MGLICPLQPPETASFGPAHDQRNRFKISCPYGLEGSSPSFGTKSMEDTRRSLFVLLVLSLGGCGANQLEQFRAEDLPRAAFDLGCPEDKLTVTPLNEEATDWNLHARGQVGVTGCGKKAVYVNMRGAGWVLNSESEQAKP